METKSFKSYSQLSASKQMKITNRILKKWRQNDFQLDRVTRHINGNTLDNRIANLQVVSLNEAILHDKDWVTDWKIDLTDKEIEIVKDPLWRQGLFTRKKTELD